MSVPLGAGCLTVGNVIYDHINSKPAHATNLCRYAKEPSSSCVVENCRPDCSIITEVSA